MFCVQYSAPIAIPLLAGSTLLRSKLQQKLTICGLGGKAIYSAPVGLIQMKLICCIVLLATGESYFKQLTANNQLGLIAGIRSSSTKVSRTSLYESSSPVEGSLSPDIPSNQVILLRESSQTSLHGGQDDEDAKCEISPIFHAYLQLEYAA